MGEWILHVDLDQFLVAVEVLRRPELAGLPVVVGGDGDPTRARQVAATASYEARAFGVHSGMPLVLAARKCPEAVFLPSDKPAYEKASARVMATLRSLPVVVEEWGWDEAFVGARTDNPEDLAQTLKERLLAETGLTCAVGIGETKLQAKTATGFAKPGGVARLTRRTWFETMGDRPVTAVWGIGERTARRLAEAGVHTVRELARADHHDLAQRFGPRIGPYLKLLGLGGDGSPVVDAPHVPRSRSREETFEHDLTSRAEIDEQVARLATEATESVVAEGRRVTHVAVKVRTATFFTRTKISKLPQPITDPAEAASAALMVLDRFELTRPVRLLGVRVMLEPLA
jgi:DNA polymerase-4